MTVAAILKEKGRDVVTATADQTLEEICGVLGEHRIGAAVITDKDRRVEGIVSERDIVGALAKSGRKALSMAVREVMTTAVMTCHEEETIGALMERMTAGKFRHLPVVKNGRLDGIVSIGDVVKLRIAEAEFEAQQMREYIATG